MPVPRWWPSATNRKKVAALDEIDGIVRGIIEDRRKSGEDRGDLLSMLVHARDEAGNPMPDRQLRDEAMTLFFAGHETTAHALTWMWYLLAKHPAVEQRLYAEIQGVTGGRALTVGDLQALPYLEMVVKESMRILPSVWSFMRETIEPVRLGNFLLPKGAYIFMSPYVMQHDARWFPEPEVFDPERFSVENTKKLNRGSAGGGGEAGMSAPAGRARDDAGFPPNDAPMLTLHILHRSCSI